VEIFRREKRDGTNSGQNAEAKNSTTTTATAAATTTTTTTTAAAAAAAAAATTTLDASFSNAAKQLTNV